MVRELTVPANNYDPQVNYTILKHNYGDA